LYLFLGVNALFVLIFSVISILVLHFYFATFSP